MLQFKKLARKPFYVSAVQVEDGNMEEIAKHCEGEVRVEETKDGLVKYIKVHVRHPLNARQTKAYLGDWVLFAGTGQKVYTDKALHRNFDEIVEVDPTQQSEKEVWVESEDYSSERV